ncbi:hydroxymethylbilane synthase [Myxococcus llanfairpwllgwyngyllgogerychwyrndrobwllllantysiliogogogochensis]|uniref:Porphobilinogen deaminase n=1 Tax=Myxococcus llanfairpwllgwyngyllgogerychwyrndrobwllllantysiliogogogochensis TaxID=2590453 RepID=A0A540WKK8_9BACT|nr:hydroxymethylbilane synthase [Myxococcus llanfairpwllgwyngyllgogerychwyrndrobwllllantysiliogogogochensis]TQF08984.1 hydroxymethylbilane synthase [Myxococcus llanfairpwllgwyngyllgogerychwyrndrobwllllantysiliogogogochensis]
MKSVRIATRQSPLALWQARHVGALLAAHHPGLEVSFVEMTTAGDRFLSAPLSAVGGKGLFVKEIEQALIDGRADLAVHSLKDMTSELPEGLVLAAVPTREDPRDAFCGLEGQTLDSLPQGARVGTSSLRRSCILRSRRPDLEIVSLRGNVQTRLQKTKELGLAGAVLAYAGLKRLGLEGVITQVLSTEVSLPAVGQGVLAIQCRGDDARVCGLLAPLEDATTRVAVTAERALLAKLEGGCTVPLAGHATVSEGMVHLRGLVGRPDGARVVRGEVRGPVAQARELGEALAEDLLSQGAADILRDFARRPDARP